MKRYLILGLCSALLAAIPLAATGGGGQADQKPKPTIKREPAHRLTSFEGKDVYREYCAVCHGTTGRGDGPAARALKTPPADLTTITKRHGTFPRKTVEETILAQNEPLASHGSREMPIWGPIFRRSGDRDVQTLITSNLISYLESIQAK
jgi:mono/diheme cytochrome c family protein